MSSMLPINASIIQDSALGPVEYVFIASDLSNLLLTNRLCKYADDTYFMVPAVISLLKQCEKNYSTYQIGFQLIIWN